MLRTSSLRASRQVIGGQFDHPWIASVVMGLLRKGRRKQKRLPDLTERRQRTPKLCAYGS